MIIINKKGIFTQKYNDNLKIHEIVSLDNPLPYYYKTSISFEEGTTFGDLMSHLEPHCKMLEEHFMSDTHLWPLKPFFDYIKSNEEEPIEFEDKTVLKYLVFRWCAQCYEMIDRRTGKQDNSLDIYLHMSGLTEKDSEETYSLSFTSAKQMRELLMIQDNSCNISTLREGKMVDLFNFNRDITFGELLSCIFHELTFFGSPESQKEEMENIMKGHDEIKDMTDEERESDCIPFEEIQIEWLNEEMKEALSEENYEWAERVRVEIEKIKSKSEENMK